jgi:hypothetical protein
VTNAGQGASWILTCSVSFFGYVEVVCSCVPLVVNSNCGMAQAKTCHPVHASLPYWTLRGKAVVAFAPVDIS